MAHPLIQAYIDAEKAVSDAIRASSDALVSAMTTPVPATLRKAEPTDIVVGKVLWYCGSDEPYWCIVDEVHKPNDEWKAYTAHDGCRYGLDGAMVEP